MSVRLPVRSEGVRFRGGTDRDRTRSGGRDRRSNISLLRARLVVMGVTVAALACAYFLAVRDLPVFAVRHVEIAGLPAQERAQVRRALRRAALRMTTLHVRQGEFDRAVSRRPTVRAVRVEAFPPDRLRIVVDANDAVARLRANGKWIAVGEDARALEGLDAGSLDLPELRAPGGPAALDRRSAGAVRIVTAAPRRDPGMRVAIVQQGPAGEWEARLRTGVVIQFGRADRLSEKWAVARRLLLEPGATDAEAVDVRVPNRPALVFSRQDAVGTPAAEKASQVGE